MVRQLRLCFVCSHWHPRRGGVERHTHELARALLRRGHAVSVLCTGADDELERLERGRPRAREEYVEGVLVRRWWPDPEGGRGGGAERAVRRWLRERAPHVVHVHHLSGFGTQLLDVLRPAGVPVALTLHDYWHLCPRGQMWSVDGGLCSEPVPAVCAGCQTRTWPDHVVDEDQARRRTESELEALAGVDRLLAPSAAVAETFRRAGLARPVHVVPNGVDAGDLRAHVQRLSAAVAPGARLGVIGSVQPSKGVLELARVVAGIEDEALTLDVHGGLESYHGDESYARTLRELAEGEPRIRIHGPFAPGGLAGVLAALDAVAVPSLWEEPFGLAAREAVAAGLPVFASARGGLVELAREAPDRCVVIPAGDHAAWTEVLTTFARGGGPRRLSGVSSRELPATGDLRSVDALADDLERIYDELTTGGASAASQAS